tara:strand:+ start:14846 stop:15640 length:795 start_codon:yes stop_codon:yes gene_type:complete
MKIKTKIYKIISKNSWIRFLLGEKSYSRKHAKYIRYILSKNLTVRSGPFAGMLYPYAESVGSSFSPKILGSYEKEISDLIEQLCTEDYTEVVDIGCAEGYYVVGLAMRLEKVKVFGFDTNSRAIELCKEMAKINNVEKRIVLGEFCDQTTLKSLPLKRALIVCDCEGYEKELFTDNIASALINHDLLIEVHDLIDPTISSHLRSVFKNTHTIDVYSSISNSEKALTYSYNELNGLPLSVKEKVLSEGRRAIMEWFYLKPKKVAC